MGWSGLPFRDSRIWLKTLSAVIFSSRYIPANNHAVFMPEKHGLKVTVCIAQGEKKANFATEVVKMSGCNGLLAG
jgi:hypothetical protein